MEPLLVPLKDLLGNGGEEDDEEERYAQALGRRFPALCRLLAALVTTPVPKSQDNSDVRGRSVRLWVVWLVGLLDWLAGGLFVVCYMDGSGWLVGLLL